LDVSQEFDSTNSAPATDQVTAKGKTFIQKTTQSNVSMSLDVQYISITDGIGNRNINLFDTVKVVHPDLGISETAKVVETLFNVLTERYESLTIGSIKKTIVDTIAKMIKKG
jgi:phage minor structural protein